MENPSRGVLVNNSVLLPRFLRISALPYTHEQVADFTLDFDFTLVAAHLDL